PPVPAKGGDRRRPPARPGQRAPEGAGRMVAVAGRGSACRGRGGRGGGIPARFVSRPGEGGTCGAVQRPRRGGQGRGGGGGGLRRRRRAGSATTAWPAWKRRLSGPLGGRP